MALRFTDGYDHYATADILKKWTLGAVSSIGSGAARLGGGGATYAAGANTTKTLDNQATWILGAAWQVPTAYGTGTNGFILKDSGTAQLTCTVNSVGGINVLRGATLLASTTPAILTVNVWAYVEFKATINSTTGSYEVRVNGTSVLSGSGVNTQQTANAYANQITVSANDTLYVDDLYILDGTGSAPHNDFLGDVRVESILPSGAGTTTQWTPSAGSNYTCVDEAAPNGDTDYVSSSTVNQVDTYAYGNLTPTTGTVYGVTVMQYARKDDAGVRSIAPVVRHSGTDYVGTTQALSTSYQYLCQIYQTNPGTSAAWTISQVNAAEFGVKLTA